MTLTSQAMRAFQSPPPSSEPFFNAPWVALVLPVLVLVAHGVFLLLPDLSKELVLYHSALLPERYFAEDVRIAYGGPLAAAWPVVGSALLHMDWMHVLVNAGMLLGAGSGVARWTGLRRKGLCVFLAVVVASQVCASLAHLLAHRGDGIGAIGASGISSGLVAGAVLVILAARFRRSRLKLLTPVNGVILAGFVLFNFVFAGGMQATSGIGIAWEAHIGGFIGGGLALWLLAREPLSARALARPR